MSSQNNRSGAVATFLLSATFVIVCLMISVWASQSELPSASDALQHQDMAASSADVSSADVPTTSTTIPAPSYILPEGFTMPTSPEVLPEKCAYLTFDDGPSENTLRILDILDRYGVKATFFVIKNPAYASFYSEILKRGHSIGLHSSSHSYKTIYSSVDAFMYDLGSIQNYVYEQTGQRPVIMRFPGGSSNTVSNKYCRGIMGVLIGEVSNKGFIYHDWNVDSGDATDNNVPPATLVANISKYSEGKATIDILMHDTGSAKETTIQALPQIIEYLQANGYTILPISDQTPPIQHRSVA